MHAYMSTCKKKKVGNVMQKFLNMFMEYKCIVIHGHAKSRQEIIKFKAASGVDRALALWFVGVGICFIKV